MEKIRKIVGSGTFKFIFSGFLLYFAFRKVDISSLVGEVMGVRWWFLAVQVGLFLTLMILGAWRWSGLVLEKVRLKDILIFLRATYAGVFYGIFFPTAVAGDALKWTVLKEKYSDLGNTRLFGSVLVDRIVGFSTFITVALAASLLGWVAGLDFPGYMRLMFGVMFLGVIIVYYLATTFPFEKYVGRNKWLDRLLEVMAIIKEAGRERLVRCLVLSVFCELLWIGQIYLTSVYFGANFGLIRSFAYLPAIYLVLILPISFAGFGAREQLYLVFFGGLVSNEKILVVSTFMGILNVLNALFGGLVLMLK